MQFLNLFIYHFSQVSACLSTKMADASKEANKVANAAADDAKKAEVKLSAKKEKASMKKSFY